MATRKHSTAWLLGRSLLPSTTSLILCIVGSIFFVVSSVLLDSINYGTILPSFLDGQPATLYTNTIVQPVETVIHSAIWNNASTIILWSFIGVGVYELLAVGMRTYSGWRAAKDDIQFVNNRTIIKHPLERSFLMRAAWRFSLTLVAFIFVLLTQTLLHDMFSSIHSIVIAQSIGTISRDIIFTLTGWAIYMHCCVVFLRLYTLRTRLFGDDFVYTQS